jgi:hypothetical protein
MAAAFFMRILLYCFLCLYFSPQNPARFAGDPNEFYLNAQHLTVSTEMKHEWEYTSVLERKPVYTFFLWIFTPDVAIFVQMLIGSIGVLLMYRMNKKAGIIWNFYGCWYDVIFLAESLIFFMMILTIYKYKSKNELAKIF